MYKTAGACLLVFAASMVLITCSGSGDPAPPECIHDGDCAAAQQCLQGQCQGLDCSGDSDCRGGTSCQGGSCETVTGCASDADCNGWSCQTSSGDCVECQDNSDCSGEMLCISSTCRERCTGSGDCREPAPLCDTLTGSCVQCQSTEDCDSAELCEGGRCVPRPTGCQSDADCTQSAPRCDTATGDCVECLGHQDCQPGQTCQSMTCVGGGGCQADGDCPVETPHCNTAVEPGQCVQCLRNAHCGSDQSCNPAEMVCLDGYLPCEACDEFGRTCQAGTVCYSFEAGDTGCLRTCEDSEDCTKGFTCSTDTCVPAYDRQAGSCEAIRDIGERCQTGADCGLMRQSDALCLGGLTGGNCSIPCKGDQDCPQLLICREYTDPLGEAFFACGQKT